MEIKDIKILIIEDEPVVRESYIDMFSFLGFKVDTAVNGKDGLEKVGRKEYHIVITDLNMPVMDGLDTLKRIKKRFPQVEVIVITGYATIENAITAMKHGAFDYITKPVSLEHVRLVLNRCLQHIRASEENEKLKNVNTRLLQLNELKDKFITITNHELRTPLAVLKGYLELLDLSIEQKNEETAEYLEIINTTLSELTEMVERMHNLSSLDKMVENMQMEQFNLSEVVTAAAAEMRIFFKKRGIDFAVDSGHYPVVVHADKNAVRKAFRELLHNALKFTPEGGRVSLRVVAEPNDRKVYISVEDNGIGIPPDKLSMIFEPFYEVQDIMHHSSSKTDFMGGGIGVGLSLVRELAEACKGEVAAHSVPGKGSTFTLILPIAEIDEEVLSLKAY